MERAHVARSCSGHPAERLERITAQSTYTHPPIGISAERPPDTVTTGQADGNALRIGHDAGFPVSDDYAPPFPWTGTVHRVVIEAKPPPFRDLEAEIADAVHRD